MVVIGVDVLILFCFGCALVCASFVAACAIPLGMEEGKAAIMSTAITALAMIVGYVIMAHVLDSMLGAYW